MIFLLAFFFTFIACLILVPLLTGLGKFFCLFAVVQECEAHVFLLFGRVIGVIDEPGLRKLLGGTEAPKDQARPRGRV